uniref:Uncharacterized protein n=1 Tax=Aquila chrysaetos chrysaetos TaxID=223781 RepID=A0A663ET74_AQUCH
RGAWPEGQQGRQRGAGEWGGCRCSCFPGGVATKIGSFCLALPMPNARVGHCRWLRQEVVEMGLRIYVVSLLSCVRLFPRRVPMESQVLEDSKASLVRKVMKDLEVSLVPPAPWACR